MIKRLSCPICGSECEYDYKSVWEGNRDLEDIQCPICDSVHIAERNSRECGAERSRSGISGLF